MISVILDGKKKALIRENLIWAGDKNFSRTLKDKWDLVKGSHTLNRHFLPGPNSLSHSLSVP